MSNSGNAFFEGSRSTVIALILLARQEAGAETIQVQSVNEKVEARAVYKIQIKGRVGLPETAEMLSPEGFFLQPMLNSRGDSVVYWGKKKGETGFNIWRTDLDGKMPVKLTDMQAVSGQPFWTSDGKNILFFSTFGMSPETEWNASEQFKIKRSPRNIWIMGKDGKDRRKLTDGPHVDERPCITPDGKSVVFVSNRSGHLNLWSVSMDTGSLKQVTKHNGLDYRPVFSPDGKYLAFFTTSNNKVRRHDLCIMTWPDGEASFPAGPGVFKWIHGPFWLADSKSILIHAGTTKIKSSLWILDLGDKHTEQLVLPGIPFYGHGSLNADESLLVFDSPISAELIIEKEKK